MTGSPRPRLPVSSYRVQLSPAFGFAAARDLASYLARLGVTECYTSPYLKASQGSTHGYDICDHGRLNPELGSEADYAAFMDALSAHGLGHILDFVPNHMGADSRANRWWRDVLENGQSSPYATFFDVEWDPIKPELRDKVLLPVLGDQYGHVLERGELQLALVDGALCLRYFDRNLPINPRQSPRVLGLGLEELEARLDGDPALREYQSVITALLNLPAYMESDPARQVQRQREKEVARERLARLVEASPPIREHVETCVRAANGTPGDPASYNLLHDLLEHQAYRLAYWRTAFHEINYRRFFDINELVAIRMEEPEVFDAAHRLLGTLIAQGRVTGLRIDHPDGLFDPERYVERLQELAAGAAGHAASPFYVVAEKILAEGESLPAAWPVHGTTGYAFMNLVAGLFVDARHAARLRRVYARATGHDETFAEVAYRSKRTILLTSMASELNILAHALNRISEGDRRCRDFTLESCRDVLREVLACFPVYRTYVTERGVSDTDRASVGIAVAEARRRNPLVEASIFAFLQDILLPSGEGEPEGADGRERFRFAMQFQQFSGPVQAKGVEDTAFYRYHVLVAANDVGGQPNRLGVSPDAFHEANRQRLESWPCAMIATATHDAKRGEDARVRLTVISEKPDEWRRAVSDWMRMNASHRTRIDAGWAPDRNDEYLFYQALVGVWPAEAADAPIPDRATDGLTARLRAYMLKAVREAKVHTSWIDENEPYGQAVARFVEKTLGGRGAARFLASFVPVQRAMARLGAVNALAQLVLKLASPGVPDFYQGTELWDLNLVDPDNRRPVDFPARRAMLDALGPLVASIEAGEDRSREVAPVLDSWHDGRIKMLVTTCGLGLRRACAPLLLQGAYVPLQAQGAAADHVVAFARHDADATIVALVPRLSASLTTPERPWPLGEEAWGDVTIALPEALDAERYRHALTGATVDAHAAGQGRVLRAADVFRTLPVALLVARR